MRKFSAIILAGGRGSRMGGDKPALRFGGQTLLERIAARLGGAFNEIIVVAAPKLETAVDPAAALGSSGVRVVRDRMAFKGPLAAAMRGLEAAHCPLAFVCGCDLPMINPKLARALCESCAEHEAAIPEIGGRLQPLHAAYSKSALARIGEILAGGESRMSALAAALDSRIVREKELRALDPQLLSFLNVNTPDDYMRALRLAGES